MGWVTWTTGQGSWALHYLFPSNLINSLYCPPASSSILVVDPMTISFFFRDNICLAVAEIKSALFTALKRISWQRRLYNLVCRFFTRLYLVLLYSRIQFDLLWPEYKYANYILNFSCLIRRFPKAMLFLIIYFYVVNTII